MTVKKFRKLPVEVEAMQVLDDLGNHAAIHRWINENGGTARMPAFDPWLIIETLEGDMRADLGDWVIRGVAGEFYPCKPDIFATTYEPVEAAR